MEREWYENTRGRTLKALEILAELDPLTFNATTRDCRRLLARGFTPSAAELSWLLVAVARSMRGQREKSAGRETLKNVARHWVTLVDEEGEE